MIFVDSSIIANVLFETELSKYALKVLKEDEPKITSETVIDEVYFTVLKRRLVEGKNIGPLTVKKVLQRSDKARQRATEMLARILGSMVAMKIVIVPDVPIQEIAPYVLKYGLLPHDARILATAIYNGADKLATLDTDFKEVKEIKLVPLEFWKDRASR